MDPPPEAGGQVGAEPVAVSWGWNLGHIAAGSMYLKAIEAVLP